jgi:hypothetical protein
LHGSQSTFGRKDKMNRDELISDMIDAWFVEQRKSPARTSTYEDMMLASLAELERRCDEEKVPEEILERLKMAEYETGGLYPTSVAQRAYMGELRKYYFFVPRNRDTKAGEPDGPT